MGSFDGIHEGNGLLNEDIVSFLRSSGASRRASSASEETREYVIEIDIAKTSALEASSTEWVACSSR